VSNYFAVQILEDGERNTVAKVVLVADTSDYSGEVVLDPDTLYQTLPITDLLNVAEIQYSVQDGWYVSLFWDAPTPVLMVNLVGRGRFKVGNEFGGFQNNASGATGVITLSTTGWSATTKVATFVIHCVKAWSGASDVPHNWLLQESGFSILQENLGHINL